jgi:hypothetical protein
MNQPYNTPESAALFKQLNDFAAHIRDPETSPPPKDLEERRLQVYREAFYNNVEDLLSNTFPVLKEILPNECWHAMVRDFYARHHARTPLFLQLATEFLDYLRRERTPDPGDPPFLLELAHYEWVELALSIAEQEVDFIQNSEIPASLTDVLALSPLTWNLTYRFPVHHISKDFLPDHSDTPTHLLVCRDRHDEIDFLELNAVSARLVELFRHNEHSTTGELLQIVAVEINQPNNDAVIAAGLQIVQQLKQRDALVAR